MRLLRRIWLALVLLWGLARGPRRAERVVEPARGNDRAELAVIALLLGVAALAVAFIVIYAIDPPNQTQYLGLALGGALALLAAALTVTAEFLVADEQLAEDYPVVEDRTEADRTAQIVAESGSGISRKRFLAGAAGTAGAALGGALVVPAAGLGPFLDTGSLYDSPWRKGRRLVDETGKRYRAADIEVGSFYTAFPEGASPEELGSPVVVVRLAQADLDLPQERSDWAPGGIVAYSKICTHAACAVSLYRKPLFAPAEPGPMLVCPCHYSTFDPATGGTVAFGPAGRDLPQLPLEIEAGELRAAGDFSGPVGPSFWGVRTRGPN